MRSNQFDFSFATTLSVCAFLGVLATACSTESSSGAGTGGSTLGTGGNVAADDKCPEIDLGGAPVPQRSVSGAAPKPRGGQISDGTYDVADYQWFESDPGTVREAFHQTMRFRDGGKVVDLVKVEAAGEKPFTATLNVTVEGSVLTMTAVCPEALVGAKEQMSFTASASEILVHLTQGAVSTVVTYRLR